ncbi:MAG: hypothetical protein COB53_05675 [Elusimicrobia bacterium]|nr:MAG: hypothetical protein COB53_05675 [Elusimicrobiota bacterium]
MWCKLLRDWDGYTDSLPKKLRNSPRQVHQLSEKPRQSVGIFPYKNGPRLPGARDARLSINSIGFIIPGFQTQNGPESKETSEDS